MLNQSGGRSPNPQSKFASTGEIVKLVILCVAALAIFGVMAGSIFKKTAKPLEPEAIESFESKKGSGPLTFKNPDGTVTKVDQEGPDVITDKVAPFKEAPELLNDVEDFTDELEFEAYYYAIHKVAALSAEQIAKETSPPVSYPDLLKFSKDKRGGLMKVQGSLLHLRKELLPENPSGLRNVYIGLLVANNRKVYTFLVFDISAGARLRDVIEMDAMFFKFWRYENRNGNWVDTPYFIARSFRKIPAHAPQPPITVLGVDLVIGTHVVTSFELIIVGLFAFLVPFIFILVRREGRKYREFQLDMIERRKKRGTGAGGKAPEPTSPEAAGSPAGQADQAVQGGVAESEKAAPGAGGPESRPPEPPGKPQCQ